MKQLKNILEIWFEELTDTFKDRGILIFILFVPIMYPLLYSYVYTNELVREVPTAVVDDSHSHLSREYLRKLDGTSDVKIVANCTDMEEAKELLRWQKAYAIIHIPSTFSKDIAHGEQTYIGEYSDMCAMLYYKSVLLSANLVALDINKDIKVHQYGHNMTNQEDVISEMPIKYDYIPIYNTQSGFASFLIPPVLMLIIQQTLLLGIGMSMGRAREKNRGCIIPLSRSYKNPVNIVLGKALVYVLLYFVMGIYMFTYVTKTFGLPQLGHYGTFIAFIIPFILSCVFFAMVFSSFVYRREDCIMLFVFISVPMLFITGISWPWSAVPKFWKIVSYLFPVTFGINGYVRINNMGASLYDIAHEYHALWLQAGIYFIIACFIYLRQIQGLLHRIKKDGRHFHTDRFPFRPKDI